MEIETLKSAKQPKSIEIVAAIDDLLTEILFRLPTESLIRCKLVSKHWQSLISNPNFRRRRNLNPVPAVGLFFPGKGFRSSILYEYEFVPISPLNSTAIAPFSRLEFTSDPLGITIVQSCNGLLLCCSQSTTTKYYVYNPSTHKFSNLPELVGGAIRGMCLAFDPTKSPHHYKVVCVRDQKSVPDRFQIEIYSSRTRAWRTCGQPFIANVYFEKGVYWNNSIHWIITKLGGGDSLYFNVHHLVLEKMPIPPCPVIACQSKYCYFGESCDHLHYVRLSGRQMHVNVYEMKRDYSGWFVKYHVDLSPLVAANPGIIRAIPPWMGEKLFYFSVVCVVRGEEDGTGCFLVVQIPGKVIRYNLVSKTFEELHGFEANRKPDVFTNGHQYVESLCSL